LIENTLNEDNLSKHSLTVDPEPKECVAVLSFINYIDTQDGPTSKSDQCADKCVEHKPAQPIRKVIHTHDSHRLLGFRLFFLNDKADKVVGRQDPD